MGIIQVTITKQAHQGKKEIAKTYQTAFEGTLKDVDALQQGVEREIKILLDDKKE